MTFNQLVETIRKIESTLNEAVTPEPVDINKLLRQKAALKKQIRAIELQILDQKRQDSLAARKQITVSNADKELSKLWRQHFDANINADDSRDDSTEWRKYDKLSRNIYDKVAKTYGAQKATEMNKHTDMLLRANGAKAAQIARQYRADHGVSDEYFDPHNDLIH